MKTKIKTKTHNPDVHYVVMNLIEKNPDITQRELAKKTGISLGSVHYCLKALAHKGWIKAKKFTNNPNKSSYLYLLTPQGLIQKSDLAVDFLRRKRVEYESLRKEIDELTEELKDD